MRLICPTESESSVPLLPASSHAIFMLFILTSLVPSTLKSDFISLSYISGAVSEVAEVEFSSQTSIKHQHRTYKYILISIHCKISPTMSGDESRWSPMRGLPGLDPWNVSFLPDHLIFIPQIRA